MGNSSNAIFCDTCQKIQYAAISLQKHKHTQTHTWSCICHMYTMSKIEAKMDLDLTESHLPNSMCVCVWVTKACLTLCDPMNCSPLTSSVHGILQARMLKWVAVPCSGGPSQPRDRTQVSCTAGRFLTFWATGKPPNSVMPSKLLLIYFPWFLKSVVFKSINILYWKNML